MTLHPSTTSPTVAAPDDGRPDPRLPPSVAPPGGPARPAADAHDDADWITAAVVFAILGGCGALWMADLSLISGGLAAVLSGVAGALFADA